ncbi:MXAN_6230/SCO0854 family RING domain-containing protein [Streptomyces boninensis]|uniref:MXAN_6230/SCO0854 family RING domain-containing protein n=1 Tax=Streptomyces boninensis TaxID=2039455 RepID=UPI003B21CB5C
MSTLHAVLLRHAGTVHPHGTPAPKAYESNAAGLVALEAELLDRNAALGARLRDALARLRPHDLATTGARLLKNLDRELGADRTHMPLFRRFPRSTPRDTHALYVDRVFSLLLQSPAQPCVLCGTVGSVHPVSPCAHLVCRTCFDGSDYTGCPICRVRITPGDPFLQPSRTDDTPPARPAAGPLRLLTLGAGLADDAARALGRLLDRRTPLSQQDAEDLVVLVGHAPADLGWLPEHIPVRETNAMVLRVLLHLPETRAAAREHLPRLLRTATDVLRLLVAWSGGDPGLTAAPPRFHTLPRPLRRDLLAVLDALPPAQVAEDLLRHRRLWKRAAEPLHPYEHASRYPRAALAFAVLRGTAPETVPPVAAELRQADKNAFALDAGGRVRTVGFAAHVEQALADGDTDRATALLAKRPGELVRRLDHLLRLSESPLPEPLLPALERALPKVGPGPLLSAYGTLRNRHLPAERRVFFPRGQIARSYAIYDARPPLPRHTTAHISGLLEAEILRRLETAPRHDTAVLDAGLARLAAPFAERTASPALVSVPRGSTQRLPDGDVLRLFLHWTEPEGTRVDLDLSVAFFDADWEFAGLCDYTDMRYRDTAAIHSGDLTSAPPPDGSTEYVDLDLGRLTGAGARYALVVVFAYNDVPFEELQDAFAGFMELPDAERRDSAFHPRGVRQRFDLSGESRVCVPMVVDLAERSALWTDIHLPAEGGYHDVEEHRGGLARLGRDLTAYFTGGSRVTMWDLACWHAAARCAEVTVLKSGEAWTYHRWEGEPARDFAARVRGLKRPDERQLDLYADDRVSGRDALLLLVDGGTLEPRGAKGEVYRLYPGPVDGCGLDRLAASDLLAALG